MVALNPQFAFLTAQCMISLVALPSPATAVAVRSTHSNHAGHLRQRPIIPAPSSSSTKERSSKSAAKKHAARGYLYGNVLPRFLIDDKLFMPKQDSDHGVEARDSPTQAGLAEILGPLVNALANFVDNVKPLLSGLLRRHEPDNAIGSGPHNNILERGLPRRHHHDHHDHNHAVYDDTIYNYGTSDNHIHGRSFYTDVIPGTAAVVVRVTGASSLKTVLTESRTIII